jgi:hypothetical protein
MAQAFIIIHNLLMELFDRISLSPLRRLANLALVLRTHRPTATPLSTSANKSLLIRHATSSTVVANVIFICQLRRLVHTHWMYKDLSNLIYLDKVFLVTSLPLLSIEDLV